MKCISSLAALQYDRESMDLPILSGNNTHHDRAGSHQHDATSGQIAENSSSGLVRDAMAVPSWDELVRDYSAQVFRVAYRLTGNRQDAEDLAQEAFVRIFRSLSGFTPGSLSGWINRIVTNLFLDQARRKSKIRFDAFAEGSTDSIPGLEPGPERSYEFNNIDRDVAQALESLNPDFRAAIVLCDMEGLSYEEVAAVLGIKLGTVRSRIHRARAELRQQLSHRAPHKNTLGMGKIATV